MSQIEQRLIDMIRPEGFDNLFTQEIQKHETMEKAFNKMNKEYEKQFGYKRYANYESYRISRTNRLKSNNVTREK